MDINKEREIIVNHWDTMFKKSAFKLIKKEAIDPTSSLSKAIIDMANQSEHILDIGTGSGYGILTAKYYGKTFKSGKAIDPSPYAIKALKDACLKDAINDIEFIEGDHEVLDNFSDESFDGIICSNVLDVLPETISQTIISSTKRLLKKDGILVLKLNFYLTDALIKKLNMECVEENTYKMNGVIRGLNFTSDTWIEFFKPLTLIKQDSYERLVDGPKDRIFVFKKL